MRKEEGPKQDLSSNSGSRSLTSLGMSCLASSAQWL